MANHNGIIYAFSLVGNFALFHDILSTGGGGVLYLVISPPNHLMITINELLIATKKCLNSKILLSK